MSDPQPRPTTPFGFTTTAAEVLAGVDLTGQNAIVTGGASGIGRETARALAGAGAAVTVAVRDPSAGARAAHEITASTGNPHVHALEPGAIATNLQKHTGGLQTPVEKRKNPAQGAATSVLLAPSPLLQGVGGRHFEDCNEADVVSEPAMFGGGVNPWALDPGNAARLWEVAFESLPRQR